MLSNCDYELHITINKTKQICLFVLGNAMASGFGGYEDFIKGILFV